MPPHMPPLRKRVHGGGEQTHENKPAGPLRIAMSRPSRKKSSRMRRRVAPSAFFNPISLVRSETAIIIVFITPTPPRVSVTKATKARKISAASGDLVEQRGDAHIVDGGHRGLVFGIEVVDAAQDAPDFRCGVCQSPGESWLVHDGIKHAGGIGFRAQAGNRGEGSARGWQFFGVPAIERAALILVGHHSDDAGRAGRDADLPAEDVPADPRRVVCVTFAPRTQTRRAWRRRPR